jgi:putative transposase
MVAFITTHQATYGVESICAVLPIAPSTYYRHQALAAAPARRSARARRDATLRVEIQRVYDTEQQVYGARKVWRQLQREGIDAPRCAVERLMRAMGLRGVVRGHVPRTTTPAATGTPGDLVARQFTAPRPNALWVADLTYVAIASGFVYVAFVIDVFARRIVGWRVATSLASDLTLAALEQAIEERRPNAASGLVHHSDRGVQYLAIHYTTRLLAAGIASSVGSRGDSYDNALAETLIGLYKTELIHRRGPWRGLADVELATLEWVWWFNHRRLLEPLGYVPPVEFEERYHEQQQQQALIPAVPQ